MKRKYTLEQTRKWKESAKKKPGYKEKVDKYNKNYRSLRPSLHMFYNARRRAKEKGLPFSITKSEIIIPEFCPVFGMRLEIGKTTQYNSPSLDRIIPERGYVSGNIQVISHRANAMKQDSTPEELRKFAIWVLQNI